MNSAPPIEYLSSFAQTSEALMLHLTTPLLTSGGVGADFRRYAEIAMAQQDYLQRMGTLWLTIVARSGADLAAADKSDRRFAGGTQESQKRERVSP
jgi:hypothetical protein